MSDEKKTKEHSWSTDKTPTKTADVADTKVFADPMASSTQGPSGAVFKGTIQHSTGAEVVMGVDPCHKKPQQVWQDGASQTAPMTHLSVARGTGDPSGLDKPIPREKKEKSE